MQELRASHIAYPIPVDPCARAQAVGEGLVKILNEDIEKKYVDEGSDLVETLKRR